MTLDRRQLLTGSGALAAAGWIGLSALGAHAQEGENEAAEAAPYTLPPLPYAYDALEPAIDTSLAEALQRWHVEPVLAAMLTRGFAEAGRL